MPQLKLQHFGHLIFHRADSLEKTLMLENIEGKKRRGPQRMGQLHSITSSMDKNWRNSGRQQRTGMPGMLQSMGSQSDTT